MTGTSGGNSPRPVRYSALDWSDALDAVQGDEDLLRSVVEAMLEECPRLMEAIRRAVAAKDPPALRLAAHTLKASMRYFTANSSAFDDAYRLEKMGKDGDLSDAELVCSGLEGEIARLVPLLVDYLRDSGSS